MVKKIEDLKVIGYPWHTSHQAELAKLFKTYDMIYNPYRTWATSSRPIPDNVKAVTDYEKGEYDFALLHIDQQCFN